MGARYGICHGRIQLRQDVHRDPQGPSPLGREDGHAWPRPGISHLAGGSGTHPDHLHWGHRLGRLPVWRTMSAGAVVLLVLRGVGAMRQWCQRSRRRGSWLAELILLKCAWVCLFYGIVGNLLLSTPNDLSARLTPVSGGLIPLPQVAETLTTACDWSHLTRHFDIFRAEG